MRKLGKAYEHDQLLELLVLIDMYFVNNKPLTTAQLDQIEKRIVTIVDFLMEVYEDI